MPAKDYQFIGVELDRISGRIAKALLPEPAHPHREFPGYPCCPQFDAVIGNVPFADVKLEHHGQTLLPARLLLAKSVDPLEARRRTGPGHVALHLGQSQCRHPRVPGRAGRFLRRHPPALDAFKREGTAVVTDIVFLTQASARRAGPARRSRLAARSRRCPSTAPTLPSINTS